MGGPCKSWNVRNHRPGAFYCLYWQSLVWTRSFEYFFRSNLRPADSVEGSSKNGVTIATIATPSGVEGMPFTKARNTSEFFGFYGSSEIIRFAGNICNAMLCWPFVLFKEWLNDKTIVSEPLRYHNLGQQHSKTGHKPLRCVQCNVIICTILIVSSSLYLGLFFPALWYQIFKWPRRCSNVK
jgi:hypothetical protein